MSVSSLDDVSAWGNHSDTPCERIFPVSRVFAYARVSTVGQTAENQLREIAAAGFAVEPRRVVSETVSGSEAIARRRGFGRGAPASWRAWIGARAWRRWPGGHGTSRQTITRLRDAERSPEKE